MVNKDKDKFKKKGSPTSFSYEFAKPLTKETNPNVKPNKKPEVSE